jgi:hypothetical protein
MSRISKLCGSRPREKAFAVPGPCTSSAHSRFLCVFLFGHMTQNVGEDGVAYPWLSILEQCTPNACGTILPASLLAGRTAWSRSAAGSRA